MLLLLVKQSKIKQGNSYLYASYGLGSQCRPNECIFGSGKPRGSGFWVGGYMSQVREWGSQFTSNLGTRWMDPVTARRVPSK